VISIGNDRPDLFSGVPKQQGVEAQSIVKQGNIGETDTSRGCLKPWRNVLDAMEGDRQSRASLIGGDYGV
jgi:hypothetical protein